MGNGKVASEHDHVPVPRLPAAVAEVATWGLCICLLLALTWGKWPDILSDFGRELYIPWQLAAGEALYRDLAYLNGPLSPYYHALLFRVGGASLLALVSSNMLILLVTSGLIHHIIREMADRPTARAAVLAFILLFGFGHLENSGNYNYITPYSHELTHGLLLTLGLMVLLVRYQDHGKIIALVIPGFLYGLIFLTKVEIFVAATAMLSGWWCSGGKAGSRPWPLSQLPPCFPSRRPVVYWQPGWTQQRRCWACPAAGAISLPPRLPGRFSIRSWLVWINPWSTSA